MLRNQQQTAFENIVGKGEIARNVHFFVCKWFQFGPVHRRSFCEELCQINDVI